MAGDLRALLETLDDAIQAYKARIAELEAVVQNQQRTMSERRQPEPKLEADDASPK